MQILFLSASFSLLSSNTTVLEGWVRGCLVMEVLGLVDFFFFFKKCPGNFTISLQQKLALHVDL